MPLTSQIVIEKKKKRHFPEQYKIILIKIQENDQYFFSITMSYADDMLGSRHTHMIHLIKTIVSP